MKIETQTIHTDYGCDFIPIGITVPKLSEMQKAIGKKIVSVVCKPITYREFGELWAKLRLLCNLKNPISDEKAAIYAYYDRLKEYPAPVIREAMKHTYKWFPSCAELIEICDLENVRLKLLKGAFND